MKVALSLAPHNRHVLRSAARLFLHDNDPERAHDIIARNAATKQDPWLIASEIALAEVAGRSPRFFKQGVRMLDEKEARPRHLTELAGSVGTEELLNGSRKKSRKAFAQSMIDPTGSALAQGEWAAPRLGEDIIPVSRLNTTLEAWEAIAFHLYRTGSFHAVPDTCWSWADADPFSIRPYEFGAATSGFIEDYESAIALANRGLEIRPQAPGLLNAAAFALGSLGRVEEAEEALDRVGQLSENGWRYLVAANRGLLTFRKGDEAGGTELYQHAIEGFARIGAPELSARARIYLAREAFIIGSAAAPELLSEARAAMKPFEKTETMLTLRRVEAFARGETEQVPGKLKQTARPSTPRHITVRFPDGTARDIRLAPASRR
jgi:tetratricopeptide (TPR) repeat protein